MILLLVKIAVAAGSLGILLCVASPTVALAIYAFVRPLITEFAFDQVKLFGMPLSAPLSLSIIGIAVINLTFQPSWRLHGTRSLFLTGVLAMAALSVVTSISTGTSASAGIKFFTAWVVYIMTYNSVRSEEDALFIYKALVVCAIIPMLEGFHEAATDLISYGSVQRVSSILGTHNGYGIFLTIIMAATTAVLLHSKTYRSRVFFACILIAVITSQVLAQNRGTWIALTMGFMVAITKYHRKLNLRWVFVVVLFVGIAFSGAIINRFAELENEKPYAPLANNTFDGRVEFWKMLLPLVMERPLTGYGIGTSKTVAERYLTHGGAPHNDYLRLALETGVFGTVFYVLFLAHLGLYALFRPIRDDTWKDNFSMLILVVYLPVISFAQNIIVNLVNFPLMLMLLATMMKMERIVTAKDPKPERVHPKFAEPVRSASMRKSPRVS